MSWVRSPLLQRLLYLWRTVQLIEMSTNKRIGMTSNGRIFDIDFRAPLSLSRKGSPHVNRVGAEIMCQGRQSTSIGENAIVWLFSQNTPRTQ